MEHKEWYAVKKKKGDFAINYPWKATNGAVCSDHKTKKEAVQACREENMECEPFEHSLSYVTDREDYVQCNICFRNWKLMENEKPLISRHFTGDKLRKFRRKYK